MFVVRGLYLDSNVLSDSECVGQSIQLGSERRPGKGEFKPHRPAFPDHPEDTNMWVLVEVPFKSSVYGRPFKITQRSRLEAGFLHSGMTIAEADRKASNNEHVPDQEKHGSYHDGMNKDAPNYKLIQNGDGEQYLPNRENEAFVLSYLESEDVVASFMRWIEEADPIGAASKVNAVKHFGLSSAADADWLAKGRRTALYASLYTSKGIFGDLNGKWKGDGSGSLAYFLSSGLLLTWEIAVKSGFLNSQLGESLSYVAPKLAEGLEQGPVKMSPHASRAQDYLLGSIPHVTPSQDFEVLTIRTDWIDPGIKDENDKVFAVITVGDQIIRETDVDRASLMLNASHSTYRLGFKWQTQVVFGPDAPNRIPISYKLFKEVVSLGGGSYNVEMRLLQANAEKDPNLMTQERAAKGAEGNNVGRWNGFRDSFKEVNAENQLLMIKPEPGKEWNFVLDRSERKIFTEYDPASGQLGPTSVPLGQDIEDAKLLRSPGSGSSTCSHDAGEGPSKYKEYNWCRTEGGSALLGTDWDYCVPEYMTEGYVLDNKMTTPEKTLTSRGQECRHDHSCDKHGKSYYWCKTAGTHFMGLRDNWDYCPSQDKLNYRKEAGTGAKVIYGSYGKRCRQSGKIVRAQVNLLVAVSKICQDHSVPPAGAASLIQVTDSIDETLVAQRKTRKGSNRIHPWGVVQATENISAR